MSKKISELPSVSSVNPTDVVPLITPSGTQKATISQVLLVTSSSFTPRFRPRAFSSSHLSSETEKRRQTRTVTRCPRIARR
jgi:hypothetical protein